MPGAGQPTRHMDHPGGLRPRPDGPVPADLRCLPAPSRTGQHRLQGIGVLLRRPISRGLSYALLGAATLGALTPLMPLLDTSADLAPAVRTLAYALVFGP